MSRSAMRAMRRCARSRVRARLKARQQLKAVLLRHRHRCSGRSSWMQAHERSVCGILERLESKGLVTSRLGEATPQRGGRAKRYFALTADGGREARETQRALEALWQGLPMTAGARP